MSLVTSFPSYGACKAVSQVVGRLPELLWLEYTEYNQNDADDSGFLSCVVLPDSSWQLGYASTRARTITHTHTHPAL